MIVTPRQRSANSTPAGCDARAAAGCPHAAPAVEDVVAERRAERESTMSRATSTPKYGRARGAEQPRRRGAVLPHPAEPVEHHVAGAVGRHRDAARRRCRRRPGCGERGERPGRRGAPLGDVAVGEEHEVALAVGRDRDRPRLVVAGRVREAEQSRGSRDRPPIRTCSTVPIAGEHDVAVAVGHHRDVARQVGVEASADRARARRCTR